MNQSFQILEFDKIKEQLEAFAYTERAKEKFRKLEPSLSESKVLYNQKETSQARMILEKIGTPPMVSLKDMDLLIKTAQQGACLLPEQLEYIGITLTAIQRMKDFLNRSKMLSLSLSYYETELYVMEDLKEEIQIKIRAGRVDDFASKNLKNIRSEIERVDSKMRTKAEEILKRDKEYFTESFITMRHGHICLPVKKEYKFKVNGSVLDKSSTGATVFVEPTAVGKLMEELVNLRFEEENEERTILYTLTDQVAEYEKEFAQNTDIIEKLDFIFAKGKLSFDMQGIEPVIRTDRIIRMVNARHPFLAKEDCVPLNFELLEPTQGIVITGPNTGGKTVAIKTVGLLSIMAQCGLHVPCEYAEFAMHNQVLCDIGDGQNISQNLSTFSAHIMNVLDILKTATKDTLVILDELGSGTDPTEGMGIAIAILEELLNGGCLFLATTHYPEVKTYADKTAHIKNARMAFDRESLRPLYCLEIGSAGESCAFYIAKRLGMTSSMLKAASFAAYGTEDIEFLDLSAENKEQKRHTKGIQRKKETKVLEQQKEKFKLGDSVMVYPDKKIGIVCIPEDEKGVIRVQMPYKKIWINHKRVKLHVKAEELYPEDYDFSIIFDTVENRKARHKMEKGYQENLEIMLSK